MKIEYAHVCDYFTVSREGKASIMGVFSDIYSSRMPSLHPQFYICIQVRPEEEDIGRSVPSSIRIIDPEGTELRGAEGQIEVDDEVGRRGLAIAFRIDNLQLTEYGPHMVEIKVDGKTVSHTIDVRKTGNG